MTPYEAAVVALVAASVFFSLVAVVGFARLPDVFARAHAASKSETLGALFGLLAAAVAFGQGATTVKLALLAMFLLVTGPTAAHAIVRAAALAGATPWTRSNRDPGPSTHDRPEATTGTGGGSR
ncbi:Na+/H+ antiporter subunit G [Salinigranum rubrum]|uniref:Na+/H+ antiporter subunit G n=1 Tax=Salinigranum rubrum TaxID=755307 RepID=A0A2I8VED9_9EURY|nr:monovalent cation/H(+) antiporter subunit G [Salinigranum rubrum]AUV80298.1 Na+/H+ antiporter subunit G [Salinigranum rubrum]